MATPAEAHDFVKRTYSYTEYTGSNLGVEMEMGDLRTQMVFFDTTETFAIFTSAFARKNDITADEVFEYSTISPWGVKLIGENYCVVHLAPLENLDVNEITAGFDLVALVADKIEKKISRLDDF